VNRNPDLEWLYRFAASDLGVRACPIEPSGGRDPDACGLTPKQRYAAGKSSRIRLALSELDAHDRFVLCTCYSPRPKDTEYVTDPAKPWVDWRCGRAQLAVALARERCQRERSLANEARKVARNTRDQDGVAAALARAEAHDAAEARANTRRVEAESRLRGAEKRSTDEAERAQARYEAAAERVRANASDLASYVHSRRTEGITVELSERKRKRLAKIIASPVVALADVLRGLLCDVKALEAMCRDDAA